jgi:glucosamine-6-phosphate deaminase
MEIITCADPTELGRRASQAAGKTIRTALGERGAAQVILATGASQFETLHHLVRERDIDWTKVTLFHLDEYIGLPATHPASFRCYLTDRFISKIPAGGTVHLIRGDDDPVRECHRLNELIRRQSIDLAFVGIGENGHLAFNDPPADFDTEVPYLTLALDENCRRQQLGEGWFPTLAAVPRRAISMSVRQIMKSGHIICSAPDARKAMAIRDCLAGPISPLYPSSILQTHRRCDVFLDTFSAALLARVADAREDQPKTRRP